MEVSSHPDCAQQYGSTVITLRLKRGLVRRIAARYQLVKGVGVARVNPLPTGCR
jgi:hypothetical protein